MSYFPKSKEFLHCPYNVEHVVDPKILEEHLAACRSVYLRKNAPWEFMEKKICKFNTGHLLLEVELEFHQTICPDRKEDLPTIPKTSLVQHGATKPPLFAGIRNRQGSTSPNDGPSQAAQPNRAKHHKRNRHRKEKSEAVEDWEKESKRNPAPVFDPGNVMGLQGNRPPQPTRSEIRRQRKKEADEYVDTTFPPPSLFENFDKRHK